jgi:hypothetical protein
MVLKYCSIQESLAFIGGCTFLPPATYCKGVQILFKHRWYVLVAAPFFLPQPIVKMVLRYCMFKHRWYVLVAAPFLPPQPIVKMVLRYCMFKHRWYVLVAAPFLTPQPIVKMVLRYCIFKHRWYFLVAAPFFLPQPNFAILRPNHFLMRKIIFPSLKSHMF